MPWNMNGNVIVPKFAAVVAAGICIFVYFSDILLDDVLKPIDNRHTKSPFVKKSSEDEDFINRISLVKISDQMNKTACLLPHLDPWDSVIRDFLDPNKDPQKSCKVGVAQRSKILDDGRLIIMNLTDKEDCFYRCLFAKNFHHIDFGEWMGIKERIDDSNDYNAYPKCDVFDVKCTVGNRVTHKYLHAHIYENNPNPLKYQNASMPFDMHVMVLDSVSMSQLFRSLPMTVHFIRNELGAIPIKFLNKVGLNSRPNSYAFLMNERAANLPKNPWGNALSGGRGVDMCKNYLDNESFIGYDFRNNGYRTMLNEDWTISAFVYPDCKGFAIPPVEHFLYTFILRIEGGRPVGDPEYDEIMFKKSCIESHQHVLSTLRNFLLKYPNEPKFSLTWMNKLSHDDMNGLYHSDKDFREFFKEMTPYLKNSFVFVMADHGARNGKVRNSEIGMYEDNNPALFVLLPEKLRQNKDLRNQLEENGKQLMVHYDLYATMLEIATTSSKWTADTPFSNTTFTHDKRNLKGSSILHPLKQPRTCNSLLIPYNYCNCQHPSEMLEGENELRLKIGETVVSRINKDIRGSKYKDECAELKLDIDFPMSLREYERGWHPKRRIIKFHLRVKPSDGLYEGFIEVRRDNNATILIDEQFPRLNRYKEQSFCIPENFLSNYCYCNSLLKDNKGSTVRTSKKVV